MSASSIPRCLLLILLASIASVPLAAAPEEPGSDQKSSQLQVLDESRQDATATEETPATGDVEAFRAAIEAADSALNRAAREREQPAFRALLAEDVIFFAGDLHRGRLEVLRIWQNLFAGKYDFRYEAETLETTAARSGEFGWSLGRARTSFTRPGLTTEEATEGHYLNLWRRSEDGAWELAFSSPVVVHPTLGLARDPRSGLMTAWPELADQIDAEIELHWMPEKTVRAASGEVAYSFGDYEVSFMHQAEEDEVAESDAAASSPGISGKGHFLAIWQKDEKGRWQLAVEGLTPPGIYGNK